MFLSKSFIPLLKNYPSEAKIKSHKLMLRLGMIKQSSAGIYSWLPLGFKVMKKIEQIVREEQNKIGAQEILMPTIQSSEIWKESGRYEKFNDAEINEIRKNNPGIKVIAHPECPPDVINASDFTGSTSGMIKYVKDNQPEKVMMVTECSMSDNVQVDNPNVKFIRPCNLCPHMKRITLPKILDCLKNETNEILMSDETIEKARKSVERMAEIGR